MQSPPGTEQFFNNLCREVWAERLRQTKLWGTEAFQTRASGNPGYNRSKCIVLTEEIGEVAKAVLEEDSENLREELIQVTAVAMAWLETL